MYYNHFNFGINWACYIYVRNGQNDIIGILDSSGAQVVSYLYDTWGKDNFANSGMESKQFAFSYAETLKFAQQPIINQTSIVRASVPNGILNQFYSVGVDRGIFSSGTMTVYGDMLGAFNQAVSGSIRIMP